MKKDINKKSDGLGITAIICGIGSIVFSWTIFLGVLFGIISVILGIMALIKRKKVTLPIIGIILSIVGFCIVLAFIVFINLNMDNVINVFSKNDTQLEQRNNNNIADNKNSNYYYNESKNNTSTQKKDEISGHSFVEKQDNSLLNLRSNGTFEYYKDKDDLTDYYYEGKYEVYRGTEIKNYILKNSSSESSQSLKSRLENISDDKLENFYFLILKNEKQYINKKNVLNSTVETPYMGTYDESTETLSIVNVKSANIYNFVKKK